MTIDPRGPSAVCPRFDIAGQRQGGFNCFEGGHHYSIHVNPGYITDGREGHRRFSVFFCLMAIAIAIAFGKQAAASNHGAMRFVLWSATLAAAVIGIAIAGAIANLLIYPEATP